MHWKCTRNAQGSTEDALGKQCTGDALEIHWGCTWETVLELSLKMHHLLKRRESRCDFGLLWIQQSQI